MKGGGGQPGQKTQGAQGLGGGPSVIKRTAKRAVAGMRKRAGGHLETLTPTYSQRKGERKDRGGQEFFRQRPGTTNSEGHSKKGSQPAALVRTRKGKRTT